MFKERFTSIKPRSDDDPVNTPHDCPFLPYIQSSFKTQYLLLPPYQWSVAGCAKYFIISLRDDLHETQHSVMKDAELPWLGWLSPSVLGWDAQSSLPVPLASTALSSGNHTTFTERPSAQTVLLNCKNHLGAEDMPSQCDGEAHLNTRGLGWL